MEAIVVGVYAGQPREIALADGSSLRTSMLKTRVEDVIEVGLRSLTGDACADLEHHGSPDQALCLYPASHWPGLRDETGSDFGPGAFGENLSIEGLDENTVRIGSIWRWGTARLQVSFVRSPCSNLAGIYELPGLPKLLAQSARLGWYCRVLTPGKAAVGEPLELEQDAPEAPTVAESWWAKSGLTPPD
jgi:MOSC domain-containing protein YiiM